jgi:hypothetical protein
VVRDAKPSDLVYLKNGTLASEATHAIESRDNAAKWTREIRIGQVTGRGRIAASAQVKCYKFREAERS